MVGGDGGDGGGGVAANDLRCIFLLVINYAASSRYDYISLCISGMKSDREDKL